MYAFDIDRQVLKPLVMVMLLSVAKQLCNQETKNSRPKTPTFCFGTQHARQVRCLMLSMIFSEPTVLPVTPRNIFVSLRSISKCRQLTVGSRSWESQGQFALIYKST